MIPNMGIGDRVRALRSARGLSAYALAQAAGITPTRLKAIEDGETESPRADTMAKLAGALEVRVDDLIAETVIPYGDNHDAGRPEHTVPIPVVGVAAGGKPIESEDLREEYPLLRHLFKSGRYAIRLFGDSMYPTLWDKDLLLVEPATSVPNVPNGKIAVVRIGGTESTVKRVHRRKKDGSWILRSDNPRYQLIEAEADEVEIVARFLKIVEGDRQ